MSIIPYIYKISDTYRHNVVCELMTINLASSIQLPTSEISDNSNTSDISYNSNNSDKIKAHILSVIAAKLTMDGKGYCGLNKARNKFGDNIYKMERQILTQLNWQFDHHPWTSSFSKMTKCLNIRKPLGMTFRYLFRYFTLMRIKCHFNTFVLAVLIMQHTDDNKVIKNIIKFSKVYRLFVEVVEENDEISITNLITEYNLCSYAGKINNK